MNINDDVVVSGASPQKNNQSVNETLEDYTLRYAPYSFRRWGSLTVAVTALGELRI